ncbi:MAG: GNAT family N-acetyltransferase [Candidatus Aenigmarchaeota archaeon]|nr:GNAT family N-acetyltransferase [Candidatus Aenigmarchaeota archaeon]
MDIKQANLADLDELYQIETKIWHSDAATKDSLTTRIKLFPEGFLVAKINNKIAGFVNSARIGDIKVGKFSDLVPFERVFKKNGPIFYIYSLQVDKAYRGKGISHKLIDSLVEIARDLGCRKIWLVGSDENTSIGFATTPVYERWGFKIKKCLPNYLEGKPGSLMEIVL